MTRHKAPAKRHAVGSVLEDGNKGRAPTTRFRLNFSWPALLLVAILGLVLFTFVSKEGSTSSFSPKRKSSATPKTSHTEVERSRTDLSTNEQPMATLSPAITGIRDSVRIRKQFKKSLRQLEETPLSMTNHILSSLCGYHNNNNNKYLQATDLTADASAALTSGATSDAGNISNSTNMTDRIARGTSVLLPKPVNDYYALSLMSVASLCMDPKSPLRVVIVLDAAGNPRPSGSPKFRREGTMDWTYSGAGAHPAAPEDGHARLLSLFNTQITSLTDMGFNNKSFAAREVVVTVVLPIRPRSPTRLSSESDKSSSLPHEEMKLHAGANRSIKTINTDSVDESGRRSSLLLDGFVSIIHFTRKANSDDPQFDLVLGSTKKPLRATLSLTDHSVRIVHKTSNETSSTTAAGMGFVGPAKGSLQQRKTSSVSSDSETNQTYQPAANEKELSSLAFSKPHFVFQMPKGAVFSYHNLRGLCSLEPMLNNEGASRASYVFGDGVLGRGNGRNEGSLLAKDSSASSSRKKSRSGGGVSEFHLDKEITPRLPLGFIYARQPSHRMTQLNKHIVDYGTDKKRKKSVDTDDGAVLSHTRSQKRERRRTACSDSGGANIDDDNGISGQSESAVVVLVTSCKAPVELVSRECAMEHMMDAADDGRGQGSHVGLDPNGDGTRGSSSSEPLSSEYSFFASRFLDNTHVTKGGALVMRGSQVYAGVEGPPRRRGGRADSRPNGLGELLFPHRFHAFVPFALGVHTDSILLDQNQLEEIDRIRAEKRKRIESMFKPKSKVSRKAMIRDYMRKKAALEEEFFLDNYVNATENTTLMSPESIFELRLPPLGPRCSDNPHRPTRVINHIPFFVDTSDPNYYAKGLEKPSSNTRLTLRTLRAVSRLTPHVDIIISTTVPAHEFKGLLAAAIAMGRKKKGGAASLASSASTSSPPNPPPPLPLSSSANARRVPFLDHYPNPFGELIVVHFLSLGASRLTSHSQLGVMSAKGVLGDFTYYTEEDTFITREHFKLYCVTLPYFEQRRLFLNFIRYETPEDLVFDGDRGEFRSETMSLVSRPHAADGGVGTASLLRASIPNGTFLTDFHFLHPKDWEWNFVEPYEGIVLRPADLNNDNNNNNNSYRDGWKSNSFSPSSSGSSGSEHRTVSDSITSKTNDGPFLYRGYELSTTDPSTCQGVTSGGRRRLFAPSMPHSVSATSTSSSASSSFSFSNEELKSFRSAVRHVLKSNGNQHVPTPIIITTTEENKKDSKEQHSSSDMLYDYDPETSTLHSTRDISLDENADTISGCYTVVPSFVSRHADGNGRIYNAMYLAPDEKFDYFRKKWQNLPYNRPLEFFSRENIILRYGPTSPDTGHYTRGAVLLQYYPHASLIRSINEHQATSPHHSGVEGIIGHKLTSTQSATSSTADDDVTNPMASSKKKSAATPLLDVLCDINDISATTAVSARRDGYLKPFVIHRLGAIYHGGNKHLNNGFGFPTPVVDLGNIKNVSRELSKFDLN